MNSLAWDRMKGGGKESGKGSGKDTGKGPGKGGKGASWAKPRILKRNDSNAARTLAAAASSNEVPLGGYSSKEGDWVPVKKRDQTSLVYRST